VQRTVAIVGLGSNLGHPRRQLARAMQALRRLPGTQLIGRSANYVTAPLGCTIAQPDYVNAVAVLRTTLAPRELLRFLQRIEHRQLRRRAPAAPRNAARTLDLDLLLYGRRRIDLAELVVPHPRLHLRAFALRPLLDVAPAAVIPGRGLARGYWRRVTNQRISRTRTHFPH
jgi:2-amino-4-hydroxy-6-hydroxymethyldihydropteridine diphosphokinase